MVLLTHLEYVYWNVIFNTLSVPEGSGEKSELEVYNFTGAGGVALSMYNTDEVCLQMFGFLS